MKVKLVASFLVGMTLMALPAQSQTTNIIGASGNAGAGFTLIVGLDCHKVYLCSSSALPFSSGGRLQASRSKTRQSSRRAAALLRLVATTLAEVLPC